MNCRDCGIGMYKQHKPKVEGQRRHESRGLCTACYRRARKTGTHIDHPPISYRPRADVIADYVALKSQGYADKQIARRMGMTWDAVYRALHRYATENGVDVYGYTPRKEKVA